MGSGLRICWVAVKEFNSSYYVGEAILVTIYIYTYPLWKLNLSSLVATLYPKS